MTIAIVCLIVVAILAIAVVYFRYVFRDDSEAYELRF